MDHTICGMASVTAQCEKLAKENTLVLAVDLPNCGETRSAWSHGEQWESLFGPSYKSVMLAYQLDRPIVTLWAENLLVLARYLKERPESNNSPVQLFAVGSTGVAALHAAALDTDNVIDYLSLTDAPASWDAAVRFAEGPGQFIYAVHGALQTYDITDLPYKGARASGP